MGREFTVEYDDFTGGHFVGDNDMKQPFNTWTGANICVTADEGFLMPDGGWTRSNELLPVGGGASSNSATFPIRTAYQGTNRGTTVTFAGEVFQALAGSGGSRNALTGTPKPTSHATQWGDYVVWVSGANAFNMLNTAPYTMAGPFALAFSLADTLGVWAWKDWLITPTRTAVYFSAPGISATPSFPAGNFVTIPGSAVITTIVPTSDTLYVGTSEAWWAINGVLGETTTLRRVSKSGTIPFAWNSGPRTSLCAAESTRGIVYASPSGERFRVLQGSIPSVFATSQSSETAITRIVNCGDGLLAAASTDNGVWLYSESTGAWRRPTAPSAASLSASAVNYYPTEDPTSAATVSLVGTVQTAGPTYKNYVWEHPKSPTQPKLTSGAFDTATVELADFMRSKEFRVNEVLVEIDKGSTTGASSATRSLALRLVTYPIVDMSNGGLDDQSTGSTLLTKNFTPNDSTAGEREMVRFRTNDAGPTFTAQPVLTLTGVKVRRVILKCEDV